MSALLISANHTALEYLWVCSVLSLSRVLIDFYEMQLHHLEFDDNNTVALNILTDNKIILISYCYDPIAQHMTFYLHKRTHKNSDTWVGACIIWTFINMYTLMTLCYSLLNFLEREREREKLHYILWVVTLYSTYVTE